MNSKICTSIEQSKKLAEILPLESADMHYSYVPVLEWVDKTDLSKGTHVVFKSQIFAIENLRVHDILEGDVYAWSLVALLNVLPDDWWGYNKHYFLEISKMGDMSAPYIVSYFRFREQYDGANFGRITHISFQSDNPVDACVAMIEKLHELKIL